MYAIQLECGMNPSNGQHCILRAYLLREDEDGTLSSGDVPLKEKETVRSFFSQPHLLLGMFRVVERICAEKGLQFQQGPVPTEDLPGGNRTYTYILKEGRVPGNPRREYA